MQKVLNLLEQHVQWIVLGVAALYVLYMGYAYVVTPPVTVSVAGEEVTPGEVDLRVLPKADELSTRVSNRARIPDMPVKDPLSEFMAALKRPVSADGLPAVAWTPPTGALKDTGRGPVDGPGVPLDPGGGKMAKLPDAPVAIDVQTRQGRSTVAIPDPAGQVDPINPGLGPVSITDRDWVTVRFTVPRQQLADAFQAAQVPEIFMKTLFLRVELVREELLPDGSWGNPIVVPPLKTSTLIAYPGNDPGAQTAYTEFARANQPEIMQPMFFTVTKGDRWGVPGMEQREGGNLGEVIFNPMDYLDAKDLSGLTPEQRQQVMDARRATAAQRERDRRQNTGGQRQPRQSPEGGDGTSPRGGRGPGGADGPVRTDGYRQAQPGFDPRRGGPMQGGGEGQFFPGQGGMPQDGVFPGPQAVQQINLTTEFPIPNGEFDPRDTNLKDFTGWAHDDTVEPGRTYRYKVRYKIKNPIYLTANVANNAQMEMQFDLVSPETPWTEPVTVSSLTNFFLAAGFDADAARSVKFEVFKFEGGTLHNQTFTVAPGDSIGRILNKVDFDTGWTMVDVRKSLSSNDSIVVITDSTGRMQTRTFRIDQGSAEYKKLKQQITEQATAINGG